MQYVIGIEAGITATALGIIYIIQDSNNTPPEP